nr:Rpn family recombination-promoting nuclease/putative transposase [Nostoc favosum]
MKTDTIFYTLFQILPGVLFELLEQSQSLALHYQFTSVEIKELARRIDGLFLPKAEFPEDPIYFVEVQFQRDDDIYWRIITEAFLYINQYKPQRRWQAVLLFAQRSLDPGVPFISCPLDCLLNPKNPTPTIVALSALPACGEGLGVGCNGCG